MENPMRLLPLLFVPLILLVSGWISGLDAESLAKASPVIKDFLEAEIVAFRRSRSLSIQGHPELHHCPVRTRNYCLDLICEIFELRQYVKETKKVKENV